MSSAGRGLRVRLGPKLAIVAAALCGALTVVLVLAPASLAASLVADLSAGQVILGDPAGSLWNGQAELIFSTGPVAVPGSAAGSADDGSRPDRTYLPGRTSWQLSPGGLLLGSLDLRLSNPAVLDLPLAVHLDHAGNAIIDGGRLHLPAQLLQGLGAPWNTLRPGGELRLEWDTLHLDKGGLRGGLHADWIEAASGLSPVVPFGHFRLDADGYFDGASLRLTTIAGPMELSGSGTIAAGGRLRFHGRAHVLAGTDAATATQLSGLVALLGRSDGNGAILHFGS